MEEQAGILLGPPLVEPRDCAPHTQKVLRTTNVQKDCTRSTFHVSWKDWTNNCTHMPSKRRSRKGYMEKRCRRTMKIIQNLTPQMAPRAKGRRKTKEKEEKEATRSNKKQQETTTRKRQTSTSHGTRKGRQANRCLQETSPVSILHAKHWLQGWWELTALMHTFNGPESATTAAIPVTRNTLLNTIPNPPLSCNCPSLSRCPRTKGLMY